MWWNIGKSLKFSIFKKEVWKMIFQFCFNKFHFSRCSTDFKVKWSYLRVSWTYRNSEDSNRKMRSCASFYCGWQLQKSCFSKNISFNVRDFFLQIFANIFVFETHYSKYCYFFNNLFWKIDSLTSWDLCTNQSPKTNL